MRFKMLLAVFCLLSMTGLASAHEFIVKPDKAQVAKGEKLRVEAQAAHVFMVSEEAEKPADVSLVLLQGAARQPVSLTEDKAAKALAGHVTLPADGTALLVGHRLPQVWSDTTEGVLEGGRKALEAQGKKVLQVGSYEKFAKTLLNPAAKDVSYKQPQGQLLEILLLTNPADIKGKGDITVQTLLDGKPVKAPVGLTHDGFSKEEDTYMTTKETDANGMVTFTIPGPGLWMLRAAASGPRPAPGIDQHHLRAVYVFPIK